ncbi:SGNH hydrolase domain-containing protein [Alphaproteobacteria bacterium]|nr:SGNH hydrolase domain-containing protein [Alphaproteobacteria bacterium]
MEKKLAELSSIVPLIIVDQIPEAGWHVPDEMIHRRTLGIKAPLTTNYNVYKSSNAEVIELFDRLEPVENISVIRTADLVCSDDTERCLNELSGLPLYSDDDHPFGEFIEMINEQIIGLAVPE